MYVYIYLYLSYLVCHVISTPSAQWWEKCSDPISESTNTKSYDIQIYIFFCTFALHTYIESIFHEILDNLTSGP